MPPRLPAAEERFVFKPDFGRVPAYLVATKAHIRREREELDAQLAAREVRVCWQERCKLFLACAMYLHLSCGCIHLACSMCGASAP